MLSVKDPFPTSYTPDFLSKTTCPLANCVSRDSWFRLPQILVRGGRYVRDTTLDCSRVECRIKPSQTRPKVNIFHTYVRGSAASPEKPGLGRATSVPEALRIESFIEFFAAGIEQMHVKNI
jgi:hypothetical protein